MRSTALLIFLSVALSLLSDAQAGERRAPPSNESRERVIFYFPDSERSFTRVPAQHLLIVTECLKNTPPTCDAYQALSRASARAIQSERAGGANPGALACGKVGGKPKLGTDLAKNQNSFCLFPDGSLISNGSVYYHARKNDEKKK